MQNGFKEYVLERFGINVPDWLVVFEKNKKVWGFVKEIDGEGVRKGIVVARKSSRFGYKPTTDFVILFGWMATRNFINIDNRREVILLLTGESDKVDMYKDKLSDGFSIILWKGRGVGLVYKNGEKFEVMFPKNRLIYMKGREYD